MMVMPSCKKNNSDDDKNNSNTSGSISGKWYLQSLNIETWINSTLTNKDSESFTNGEFLDFYSNNRVATYLDMEYDTVVYSRNGNTINFDGEPFVIQSLTNTELILYGVDTYDENGITYEDRITINSRR